ncbi:MAG: AAA family ATPase [Planctomycetaceae bacterium]
MWGQSEQPSWFFNSRSQTEACHRLAYLIENGEPFGVLEGRFGSGKSALLRHLRVQLNRPLLSTLLVSAAALDEVSLLWHIAASLSVLTPDGTPRSELLRLVQDELSGRTACGHRTILLLDDIHLSFEDVSSVLQGLVALARQASGGIAVIVATEQPIANQLRQLSGLSVVLEQFADDESAVFLRQLLLRRNADMSQISDAAIQAAASACGGSAGRLVRICDALQAVHYAHPGLTINPDVVEEAARELLPRKAG